MGSDDLWPLGVTLTFKRIIYANLFVNAWLYVGVTERPQKQSDDLWPSCATLTFKIQTWFQHVTHRLDVKIIYAKLFVNACMHVAVTQPTHKQRAMTFDLYVRPSTLRYRPDSCTWHMVLMWRSFMLSYLKMHACMKELQSGYENGQRWPLTFMYDLQL